MAWRIVDNTRYLVEDYHRGQWHDGLYCANLAQTFFKVLRMRLPKLHSRDRLLAKRL